MNFLESLIANVPLGIWITDCENNIKVVNNRVLEVFSLDRKDLVGKNISNLINEDNFRNNNITFSKLTKHDGYDVLEYRHNDRTIELYRILVKDNEVLLGTLGICIDMTSRVNNEEKLLRQKTLLRSIIDAIPKAISYKDKNQKFLGCNKLFESLSNIKENDLIGKTTNIMENVNESANIMVEIENEVGENEEIKVFEKEILLENGKKKFYENIKNPIYNEADNIVGSVSITSEITERKRIEEELIRLSYNDKLTGLYNRTYFDKTIDEIKEEDYPVSIIMGDVNGLKTVNDILGHLEGDKFLASISKIIKKCVGQKGLSFRWGGDEFIVILKNMELSEVEEIVDDIQIKCKEEKNSPIPLSISLGISIVKSSEQDIDSVIKIAEDEVYRKKFIHSMKLKSGILESLRESIFSNSEMINKKTDKLVEWSIKISKQLNLFENQIDDLILVATLKDIGFVGIPRAILKKKDLNEVEEQIFKSHTEKGFRLVQIDPALAHISRAILTHHERWNGSGYPLGLKGSEIPLVSRIISVLEDYYDMINIDKLNKNFVIQNLKKLSGINYEPRIVEAFIKIIKDCN